MVSKTRDKLIDVARQLFAHKGIENTTMNDIATASDKGRRTIYTYFKNKRDIYNAVVERESDQLMERLNEIAHSPDISPVEKLRQFLVTRFDLFVRAFHKRSLSTLFGRDLRRIDRIHRLVIARELTLLREILDEGVKAGAFDAARAAELPALESMAFQGIDYAHFRDNFAVTGMSPEVYKDSIINFMVDAVAADSGRGATGNLQ